MSIEDSESFSPNPANPDPATFYELVSIATGLKHHRVAKPNSLSTFNYCMERHETISKKKFDLKIHEGDSKKGTVLGVVKLHVRGFTVGLGDPDKLIEDGGKGGERMVWEKLEKPEKWNHKVYYFEYGSGEERKMYTYRKIVNRIGALLSMELRLGGVEAVEGELVAKWVRGSKWLVMSGNLFIKRRELREHGSESTGKETGKESNDWELMIMLSVFGIIENRARSGR